MIGTVIQELDAALVAIEQQHRLYDERGFVARVQALDRLSWHILDRIENVMYVHGYDEALASVYSRAIHLQQRLEAVNRQLFGRLRHELLTGTALGLRQLCATYVGEAAPVPDRLMHDEDYLDVFIDGLLILERATTETVTLQPEMIGYVPTPARVIFALLDHIDLGIEDVFYDIGSGLGRLPLLVGLLTAAQAKGVDIEPAYCLYAQQSANDLHLHRVSFINGDARETDYTDGTVFFLYTPFTGRLFQTVLDRLHLQARLRPMMIATYGRCMQQTAQQSWLQPISQQTFEHDTLALFTSRYF